MERELRPADITGTRRAGAGAFAPRAPPILPAGVPSRRWGRRSETARPPSPEAASRNASNDRRPVRLEAFPARSSEPLRHHGGAMVLPILPLSPGVGGGAAPPPKDAVPSPVFASRFVVGTSLARAGFAAPPFLLDRDASDPPAAAAHLA